MSDFAPGAVGESFDPNEWRPIPGYEDLYEVSTVGLVRTTSGRMRRPQRYGHYLGLVLHQPVRTFYIHQLVALAFIGPRPFGMSVNHKDFDRHNNRWTNLEYLTPKDNVAYSKAAGRMKPPPVYDGERNARAIVTADEAREIRALHARFRKVGPIAELFGVKRSLVEDIVYKRCWKKL